ncbi:hypothetical protein [Mucisphaera sp.]|uniref:hypothetical protein n=1 Tax=Mucisphaera sp. TaxID=2913024 RepID=UPI003D133ED7
MSQQVSKAMPILAMTFMAATPALAANVTVIDWGGTGNVTESQRLNRLPNIAPSGDPVFNVGTPTNLPGFLQTSLSFSEAESMTPSPEGWVGEPGTNQNLYGGFETVGAGNRVLEFASIGDSGGGDFIRVGIQTPDRAGLAALPDIGPFNNEFNGLGLIGLIPKTEFLIGSDPADNVVLNNDSIIRIIAGGNNNAQDRRFRLVVKQDDTFYIGTAPNFSIVPPTNVGTMTISSAGGGNTAASFDEFEFEEFDPYAGIYFSDAMVGTGTPFTGEFNDVQAIGFYIGSDRRAGNSGLARVLVRGFSVETPIPTPSTAAIGLLGLGAGLMRRRA